MSYKITITNNETGKILVDNDNAVAIVGAVSDEEKVGQMCFTDCDLLTLVSVTHGAEDAISRVKDDVSLQLMKIMKEMDVDKSK